MLNKIANPKRDKSSSTGRAGWYPYYAGFSASFAESILDIYCEKQGARVLDPWNGSGTTTASAAGRGLESLGFDLNPVMTLVARARLLNKRERSSLLPLARVALQLHLDLDTQRPDALSTWFEPSAVRCFRSIEAGIQRLLLESSPGRSMFCNMQENEFSDLLGFFYVAIFRTARTLLSSLQSSNPTWMKLPASPTDRLSPSKSVICDTFLENVRKMERALDVDTLEMDGRVRIEIASSTKVPVESASIDFVLTSPPYCTRIDYAAATRIELAVLGIGEGTSFESLRRTFLGTPTVPKTAPLWKNAWGEISRKFLEEVRSHPSRASETYYYKGHCQYFEGMQASIAELQRCIKPNGRACVVVQDSYYKDIHIDLPSICTQMAEASGLKLDIRKDFAQQKNLAQLNPRSKAYRARTPASESVLIFIKEG